MGTAPNAQEMNDECSLAAADCRNKGSTRNLYKPRHALLHVLLVVVATLQGDGQDEEQWRLVAFVSICLNPRYTFRTAILLINLHKDR